MSVHPESLKRLDNRQIEISWSDGVSQIISYRTLRDNCPCASCRVPEDSPSGQPTGLRVLSAAETIPLAIESMNPVGNYAYSISFSDGHNTGIFSFDLLRRLEN